MAELAKWKLNAGYDDFSGNGRTLTPVGPPATIAGHLGTADTASVFGSVGNYLTITDPVLSNMDSSFSVSLWCYLTGGSGSRNLINVVDFDGESLFTILYNVANEIQFAVYTDIGIQGSSAPGYSLPLNTWVHLVFINDLNANRFIIYADTVSILNIAMPEFSLNDATGTPLRIGTTDTDAGQWPGYIDDVVIYNEALTLSQVFTLNGLSDDFGDVEAYVDVSIVGAEDGRLIIEGDEYANGVRAEITPSIEQTPTWKELDNHISPTDIAPFTLKPGESKSIFGSYSFTPLIKTVSRETRPIKRYIDTEII